MLHSIMEMKDTKVTTKQWVEDDFFDTEYLKADLKGRSIRGGAITLFAQGSKFILGLGSTMVLARLLTPADFGLIAMVTALANFAMMFKDMGLSTATVQMSDINQDQISTLFWINAGIGLLIALILVACAPAVAWFYGEPQLTAITMVLASVFIFGGLTIQHQALLKRHMRFFALSLIEIIAMIIGISTATISAALGAGFWALVIMQLAIVASTAIGVGIVFPWWPGLPKRGTAIREMLAFGGNLTGFNVVNYFARNLDNILIGKYIGSVSLGLYNRAYQLLLFPIRQINFPLQSVAVPALSRLKDEPQRFRNYYRKSLMLTAMVGMPIVAFLFVVADDVVLLVLGNKWLDVVPIFRVLGPAAFIGTTYAIGTGVVFVALGNVGRQLKMAIGQTISLVVFFCVGVHWGAIGVAAAFSLYAAMWRLPQIIICFWRTPLKLTDFLIPTARPVFASLMAGLFLSLGKPYLVLSDYRIVSFLSFFVTYFSLYLLLWALMPNGRTILFDTFSLVTNLKRRTRI